MEAGSLNCPPNLSDLQYDTACLQIHNELNDSIDLFSVSSECIQCNASYWATLPQLSNVSLIVSADHSLTISATRQNDDIPLCERLVSFTQHEVASWAVKNCSFTVVEKGENASIPLYVLASGSICLLLLFAVFHSICSSRWLRNLFSRNQVIVDLQNDLGNPSSSTDSLLIQSELVPLQRLNRPRIIALDTFRGLTISLMIFVNYGGGKYWFFEHSAWNGITVADVVFPWFAWVMGVSLVLSYRSKLRTFVSRSAVLSVSYRRAGTLIILGLLLNMYNNNDLSSARFCGVLQRLGLAHLVVSTLEITFMNKHPSYQGRRWLRISEILDCWRQWLVILILAGTQMLVSLYLEVPGCPRGYLGPGGLSNPSAPLCTGSAARHIDSLVFGDNHLYQHSPVRRVYHPKVPFDPEGLLGTLSTCLTVYLGVQAGYILLTYNTSSQRCARWLFWALLTGVAAGFLSDWSLDGGVIPINKQLWSLSYALLTSSAAFVLLTVLFVVIDHFSWWWGSPFRYAGMNAILLYIGHIVTKNTFPWSWKPHETKDHAELLAMNVVAVILWMFIAKVLHRNDIFLTI